MFLTCPALLGAALREVIDAVASCRFEAGTEPAAEEAMLMRFASYFRQSMSSNWMFFSVLW
jgi:hypothetical protein